MTTVSSTFVQRLAQAGLFAKGTVYCILGILAFMAAFHINGQSTENADKAGVLGFVYQQTGGKILLALIALGLLCYCLWRGFQAFGDTEHEGKEAKGMAKRARYFLSGLAYAFVAALAVRMLFFTGGQSGGAGQDWVQDLMNKPAGQWLVGIAGLIFISIGIYQVYYGLSEKYLKYAAGAVHGRASGLLAKAGKAGYVARGIVWLIIGWLFIKAALHSNSSEAGDTAKAFSFISEASYGPYLLAAMGIGLICYGLFNFIRARHERYEHGANAHA